MLYCVLLVALVIAGVAVVRNEIVYKNYMIIVDAINNYIDDTIKNEGYYYWKNGESFFENRVTFDDIRSYYKTFLRFWDWGYENILPPEKYEIIKPYIDENNKEE